MGFNLKGLWEKHRGVTSVWLISLIVLLLTIDSNLSLLLFYFFVFILGIILLVYINRRKQRNQKISRLFVLVCICLTIFGLLDLISVLLKIFMNGQADQLDSLSRTIHIYGSFILSLSVFLFGLVLISEKSMARMGWIQNGLNDRHKALGLWVLKIIGVVNILLCLFLAAIVFNTHFILLPDLQNRERVSISYDKQNNVLTENTYKDGELIKQRKAFGKSHVLIESTYKKGKLIGERKVFGKGNYLQNKK